MPNWVPVEEELNDRIAEAYLRADEARRKKHESIKSWMPELSMPAPTATPVQLPSVEMPPIQMPDITPPEATAGTWQPQTPTYTPNTTYTPQEWTFSPPTQAPKPTVPTPTPVSALSQDTAWWEQPAQWAKTGEELLGQGLSHIPLIPKALAAVAPVFDWVHENLEKPFASIITAPFAPDLPWKQGESWMEHTKRNYETWQAPTYVKGLAEFAMPLWWLPWVGWAGKGAQALGIGGKMARAAAAVGTSAGTLGKVILPTSETLGAIVSKPSFLRTVAQWAENKPALHQVVQFLGGPAAFVKAPEVGEPAIQTAKRAVIKYKVLDDMKDGVRGLLLPKLQVMGDPIKLLDIDKQGLVRGIKATDNSSMYLNDFLEGYIKNPDNYTFATKEAKAFTDQFKNILDEVYTLAKNEGVNLKPDIVHRLVTGKTITVGDKTIYAPTEYGSRFEVGRHYKTEAAGVVAGVEYSNNPLEIMSSTINHYIRAIATKRLDNEINALGKTALERFSEFYPKEADKIAELGTKFYSGKYASGAITSVLSRQGRMLPGATMAKISRGMPDVAGRLSDLFSIQPGQLDQVIGAMGREIFQQTKLNPRTFKTMMAQFVQAPDATQIINQIHKGDFKTALSYFTRGGITDADATKFINLINASDYSSALNIFRGKANTIRVSDIEDFVRSLNLSNEVTEKALSKAYAATYESRRQFIKDSLTTLRDEVDTTIKATQGELKPYKAQRSDFLKRYQGYSTLPSAEVPYQEARVLAHPAFGNRFFPKEVADLVEKNFKDKSTKWLRDASALSGVSRMLIASLDFSAPFIQGLAVLGRNPVAWAKATAKQFEFFVHPQNMYAYMTRPDVMAVAADRIAHGGSRSTFEFFQAMKPLQDIVEKVPVVGGLGKKAIGQTFGRAEAAFTGYGEVARNEMWKALRKPGMNDLELTELAQTVDRMTGVMSTAALGISRSQQEFESAFMFFAPRYTRASLAFAGSMLRGGMMGAEARKSLGALMAGGMAFYIGTSKALGQRPDLNPTSGKFMTIRIGDSHVGIGGIMYGLGRLTAGVIGTATGDQPSDLVALSRFDNPFLKFMFDRTSPLTGTIANVVEQKDYFGQPFESAADWAKFIAEKVMPISLQQQFLERGGNNPLVFAASIAGGRTFPESAWESRNDLRDEIAQKQFGQPYGVLSELQQRRIDETPEIKILETEADKRTEQLNNLSTKFLSWKRNRDDAHYMFIQALNQSQAAYDKGLISGKDFKDNLQEARYGLAQTYKYINTRPEYKKVMEGLAQPRNVNNKYIGDIAYDELIDATYSGRFEDQYGIFDYAGYNDFRNKLRQKYGDAIYQYIVAREQDNRKEMPPLAQEYYKARDILKPYWEIANRVEQLFGKAYANSKHGQSLISKQRKNLKLSNAAIAKALQTFYSEG